MISINLNRKETLEYVIETQGDNKLVSANLVVSFPDGTVHRFKASMKGNLITIRLPILKDSIEKGIGECYLELQDTENLFYRVCNDKVSFQDKPTMKIKMTQLQKKPTVKVIHEKQIKPPIIPAADYFPKPPKPPTRKEVIKMANFFGLKK